MKKAFAILCLAVTCSCAFGQKISNIDFDTIEARIKDTKSAYYYSKLIDRFQHSDSTLTNLELACIYYGNVFSENYDPYGVGGDDEQQFYELYKEEKYKKAIPYGKKALRDNIVNPKLLFKMLVCYDITGDKKTARKYADMYFPLLDVIFESGDGKSMETPYVVINVGDEYEILSQLELSITGQSLNGYTDVLRISPKNQKQEPLITQLYFDVSKPLGFLEKELSGTGKTKTSKAKEK